MEEGDPTINEDSEMDNDSKWFGQSLLSKPGVRPHFGDRLYFTPDEKWIPKKLVAPTVAKPAPKCGKQPAAKPTAASSSIPVACQCVPQSLGKPTASK